MHFLMPDVFASHSQFRDWFCSPLTGMVEGSEAFNKVSMCGVCHVPMLIRAQ